MIKVFVICVSQSDRFMEQWSLNCDGVCDMASRGYTSKNHEIVVCYAPVYYVESPPQKMAHRFLTWPIKCGPYDLNVLKPIFLRTNTFSPALRKHLMIVNTMMMLVMTSQGIHRFDFCNMRRLMAIKRFCKSLVMMCSTKLHPIIAICCKMRLSTRL